MGSGYTLDQNDMDCLRRFQARTASTLTRDMYCDIWSEDVVGFTFSRPYLLHLLLVVTNLHDRDLDYSSRCRSVTYEAYHWSRAAQLISIQISQPICDSDHDPLWASAILLSTAAAASMDATETHQAWPLKTSEESDLDWLRLCCDKIALKAIINPSRTSSIFHQSTHPDGLHRQDVLNPSAEILVLLHTLQDICELQSMPDPKANPYQEFFETLKSLLCLQCDSSSICCFITIFRKMNPRFINLLAAKDFRALLLLCMWYAKVCHSCWWISTRATLECQAISIYLERHHFCDRNVMSVLGYIKSESGLGC